MKNLTNLTLQELLQLNWNPRTLDYYEYLKTTYGDREAETYLRVSHKIDTNPSPTRELEIMTDPFCDRRSRFSPLALKDIGGQVGKGKKISQAEYNRAIDESILQLIHPHQLPMRVQEIEFAFAVAGFEYSYKCLGDRIRALVANGDLIRLDNPYRGGTYLYCHPEFKDELQPGDKVLKMIRRRASRCGQIVSFRKLYNGSKARKLMPVVVWDYKFSDGKPLPYAGVPMFEDPSLLILIERKKA